MTKILFGQSYYLRFDPKLWGARQPYPPLGTLYAASFMRQRGYQVALFDAVLAESERDWAQALDREKPDIAVIYEDNFNYLSKMCLLRMREAAFEMIAMARGRECPVIVCGSDATDHVEDYLHAGADFVLIGEGEQTLGELVDRLSGRSRAPFEQILGLAYTLEGEPAQGTASTPQGWQATPSRPEMRALDALPFPAWDLVDVPRYKDVWVRHHGYFSMNMVTTRGCPFHCNWCAKPIWGQRYNVRSPQNVVAELKWLRDTYAPDHIWFADDIMGLKPGWLAAFAAELEQQGVHVPFKCLSRVDLLLRPGDIEALQRAGAQIVWVGAESGSQKILNAMEKGTRVEQIHAAAQRLQAAGIQVGFFLQFGYPGETLEDIEDTIRMVRDCMPDDIGISVSYPLPGTPFHQRVADQLGLKQNWYDSQDLAMLYEGPFPTDFYRQLHSTIHKEYRLRLFLRELKKALRSLTFRPRLLAKLVRALYYALGLPVARFRLKRLATQTHRGVITLEGSMSLEKAAQPTPQD